MAEPRERPDLEALSAIAIVQQRLRARLERAMPAGLSAAGFDALTRLASHNAPTGPAELADALGLTRAAITNTLIRLEAAGWIAIAGDDRDGRRKRLSLTPEGARIQREAARAARPELEALRAGVDPAEAEAALPFLRSLKLWLTRS
ncbi:MAG: MarR family transcriptional regulator [Caulobacteraceae bacterium]